MHCDSIQLLRSSLVMNTYSIYMYLIRNKNFNFYLLIKLNLKYFLSPCVYIQMADERQSGSGSSGSTSSSSSSSDTTEGEARDVNEEEKKN